MVLNPKARFAIVLVAAACSLSGCVWGNHEVDPPGPGAIQGYYESQMVQGITIAVTKTTGAGGTTGFISVSNTVLTNNTNSAAYAVFSQITDPVFLAYDSSTGYFSLEPPNDSNPPIWYLESDDAGNLAGSADDITAKPMPDTQPNCEWDISYTAQGTYSSSGPFTTGSSLPLSGRIAFQYVQVSLQPNSYCSTLEACYNSSSACDANDNSLVQAEFNPFINAKQMSATDIPNVQSLEYQVSYQ